MNAPSEPFATLDLALLNDWQRAFPLDAHPFAHIAQSIGSTEQQVIQRYRHLQDQGAISRIGGVFGVGAGGSAMLCALAVPPDRLTSVAAFVNGFDYVNHNYERRHHWNLWFVVTAPSKEARDACVSQIESATGLRSLRLPMKKAFRIDLGFDLQTGATPQQTHRRVAPVAPEDMPLAAAIESGLPLVDRPYAHWAHLTGRTENDVITKLATWQEAGTLRRFGVVVRHHELGVHANAMTVFNVPDAQLPAMGSALAAQPGITLCYARQRDEGWPYNLYCMVHGRTEPETLSRIQSALKVTKLADYEHAVLFSAQRFKQTGGSYFRTAPQKEAA